MDITDKKGDRAVITDKDMDAGRAVDAALVGSLTGGGVQEPCKFCGQWHGPLCPSVKAIEYYPDGAVKRIEYR